MSNNNDGSVSFFGSIVRFVTFYKWRKSLGIARAADAQFTGSASGISDAFDLEQRRLTAEYNSFFEALSGVEQALEERRARLKGVVKERQQSEQALEGALRTVERAEASGDTAKVAEATADATTFAADVERKKGIETTLLAEISEQESSLQGLERRAMDMQTELRKMPADKAAAMADFVSNTKLKEANERLMGLKSSVGESSPLEAVRKANEALAAQARVSGKLAGIDATDKTKRYLEAGATGTATDTVAAMLKARKAEREGTTGDKPAVVTESGDSRPKI